MKIQELKIPAAGTWARDCLLTKMGGGERFQFEYNKESDESNWRIIFNMVIAYKVTSEEFTMTGYLRKLPNGDYYIYEIIDSPWLEEFKNIAEKELFEKLKHYVFCLYDETIEVLSDKFTAEKINQDEYSSLQENEQK